MLRLTDAQTRELLAQPETGMGYQEVVATLKDYKVERATVFNAKLIFLGRESRGMLNLSAYPSVLRTRAATDEIRSLRVLPSREGVKSLSTGARSAAAAAKVSAGPAKTAPVETIALDQSAYEVAGVMPPAFRFPIGLVIGRPL